MSQQLQHSGPKLAPVAKFSETVNLGLTVSSFLFVLHFILKTYPFAK